MGVVQGRTVGTEAGLLLAQLLLLAWTRCRRRTHANYTIRRRRDEHEYALEGVTARGGCHWQTGFASHARVELFAYLLLLRRRSTWSAAHLTHTTSRGRSDTTTTTARTFLLAAHARADAALAQCTQRLLCRHRLVRILGCILRRILRHRFYNRLHGSTIAERLSCESELSIRTPAWAAITGDTARCAGVLLPPGVRCGTRARATHAALAVATWTRLSAGDAFGADTHGGIAHIHTGATATHRHDAIGIAADRTVRTRNTRRPPLEPMRTLPTHPSP